MNKKSSGLKNTKIKKSKSKFSFSFTFFIAFCYSFLAGNGKLFLLYTIAVILHELVHTIVAMKLGYTLEKFRLSITGASMNLEEESFYGFDEFVIAIAGPLFNLLVFIMLIGSWWIMPVLYNYTLDFALVNLFVFAINILPIYSLDGGRIIVALVSKKWDRKKGVRVVRNIGLCFSALFFVLFIISFFIEFNFSLGVISVFLFVSCSGNGDAKYVQVSSKSKKDKIKNGLSLELKSYVFSSDAKLIELYRKLKPNTFTSFCVVNCGKNLLFDEDKLFLLIEKYGAGSKVVDCLI